MRTAYDTPNTDPGLIDPDPANYVSGLIMIIQHPWEDQAPTQVTGAAISGAATSAEPSENEPNQE